VNTLDIRIIKTKKEFDQAIAIRKEVFVEGQNVPVELEIDGLDDESEHVIAYLDEEPVGCARIRFNTYAKLERIAIVEKYRGRGFGRQLTDFLIDYCKQKDVDEIRLHSQTYVAYFYKKHGFRIRGNPFFEADIEHVEMYMKN
jgi:predicted GNAT family N-acyltransferase